MPFFDEKRYKNSPETEGNQGMVFMAFYLCRIKLPFLTIFS